MDKDLLIEKYLKKQLSQEEQTSFEKRLENDTELRKQFFFEKEMFDSFNDDSWSFIENNENDEIRELDAFFKSDELQSFKKTIAAGEQAFKKKPATKIRKLYFIPIAASIVLLIGVFYKNFNTTVNNEQLYNTYIAQTNLPSFINRGDTDKVNLAKGEALFNDKKYSQAVDIFEEALKTNKDNANLFLYTAISYIELNQYKKASSIIEALINSDLIDAQKGYWYKGLLYIKQKKYKKAKNTFKLIVDKSYYNKEKAAEIIDILD